MKRFQIFLIIALGTYLLYVGLVVKREPVELPPAQDASVDRGGQ